LAPTLALLAAQSAQGEENLPFPIALGGPYELIDQHGQPRTEADPDGHHQLLFFGYANCSEICSVALPQMVEITAALNDQGITLSPVLITVDPERDTVANLGPAMAKLGPDFVGLTGDAAALAQAYKSFSIDSSVVFEDPAGGKVFAHGSFLYLLDGRGELLTVLPPILTTERMVEVIEGYAGAG
jgi:protein SCO1